MNSAYYDSAFLFKALTEEDGSDKVQAHARMLHEMVCCAHGRIEFASICHRKVREGAVTAKQAAALIAQMRNDVLAGGIRWLPISEPILARAEATFVAAPSTIFLRAADALHLACAAENGFAEVYSNDRLLAAAAPLFGLRCINLIYPTTGWRNR